MEEKFTLNKLNGQNFDAWKFKMEMYLIEKDLWGVTIEETPRSGQALLTWEKKDKCARAKIALSVEDDQLIHIKYEATAAGMWNSLVKVYEKKV